MSRFFSLSLALLLAFAAPCAPAPAASHGEHAASGAFDWNNAIIQIEVTSKAYNYIQPWERSERSLYKSGVVVDNHRILTTADGLNDATVIRLKKQGDGVYSLGRIAWIDYQANLATITTDEKDFWTGLQPARLADPVPVTGDVRIQRWRDESLESRQGEIERMTVENAMLSFVSVPALKIDSSIPAVGYGEAVTSGDKLIGLVSGRGGDALTAFPSSFIAPILKAQAAGSYTGLGYFDFTWDQVQNPLNVEYLKLPGPTRGVIVKETGLKPGVTSIVKPRDILTQIDGFDIDADGNYHDPQYKKLCLENLSSRGKWAGMDCKMKIWRDGKEMDIVYKLPKCEYTDDLVPSQLYDQTPEYVMAGGLVFVPLSEPYLRSWGGDWRQHAPFRLTYYENDKVTPERPQRVVLAQVLPAPSNIGYESARNVVVDEVNGVKIKRIGDILTALKTPVNGFDVFRFEPGGPVCELVLDTSQLDEMNQAIMAHYHLPADHCLNGESAPMVKQ